MSILCWIIVGIGNTTINAQAGIKRLIWTRPHNVRVEFDLPICFNLDRIVVQRVKTMVRQRVWLHADVDIVILFWACYAKLMAPSARWSRCKSILIWCTWTALQTFTRHSCSWMRYEIYWGREASACVCKLARNWLTISKSRSYCGYYASQVRNG